MKRIPTLSANITRFPAILTRMPKALAFEAPPRIRNKRTDRIVHPTSRDDIRRKGNRKSQKKTRIHRERTICFRRKPVNVSHRTVPPLKMSKNFVRRIVT